MKTPLCYGAAALLLLSVSAIAQDRTQDKTQDKTQDPNTLTVQAKRPTLQISDQQRAAIQEALVTENTQQKTPPKFEPKVGDTIPSTITVDVIPPTAVARDPSLQPYGYAKLANGYAKLAKDLLVIDPTDKKIVAVIPRQEPTTGKDVAPADWAKTKGRELTGQQPEPASNSAPQREPAGDSGDKANGNEQGKQQ
jgi:hypothetical protein